MDVALPTALESTWAEIQLSGWTLDWGTSSFPGKPQAARQQALQVDEAWIGIPTVNPTALPWTPMGLTHFTITPNLAGILSTKK